MNANSNQHCDGDDEEDSFLIEVFRGIEDDDQDEIEKLWNYSKVQLGRMGQNHLRRQDCHGIEDEEDVSSCAVVILVRGVQSGKFRWVRNRKLYWTLMARITFRLASHASRRYRRDQRHRLGTTDFDHTADNLAGAPHSPDYFADHDLSESIAYFITTLAPDQRNVAELVFQGTPVPQIAQSLNLSRAHVYRARKTIEEKSIRFFNGLNR